MMYWEKFPVLLVYLNSEPILKILGTTSRQMLQLNHNINRQSYQVLYTIIKHVIRRKRFMVLKGTEEWHAIAKQL